MKCIASANLAKKSTYCPAVRPPQGLPGPKTRSVYRGIMPHIATAFGPKPTLASYMPAHAAHVALGHFN